MTKDGVVPETRSLRNLKSQVAMQIPSIEEIKACTDLVSPPDASAKVVKMNDSMVVKYGHHVSPIEADTLRYLGANSKVPVPKVFASFTEPETGINFIAMELIPGTTLEHMLPDLLPSEKVLVETQLREAVKELRCLASGDYIGSIGRQKCEDSCFYTPDGNSTISGPFTSIEEMIEGMAARLKITQGPANVELMRRMMLATLTKSRRIVFTHGDLQAKNIMVTRSTGVDGGGHLELKIIDWETSGWYPEYWEFYTAARSGRYRSNDWLDLLLRIMPIYEAEYPVLQMIWSMFYW